MACSTTSSPGFHFVTPAPTFQTTPGAVRAADVMPPLGVVTVAEDRDRLRERRPDAVEVDAGRHHPHHDLEGSGLGDLDLLDLVGAGQVALALRTEHPSGHRPWKFAWRHLHGKRRRCQLPHCSPWVDFVWARLLSCFLRRGVLFFEHRPQHCFASGVGCRRHSWTLTEGSGRSNPRPSSRRAALRSRPTHDLETVARLIHRLESAPLVFMKPSTSARTGPGQDWRGRLRTLCAYGLRPYSRIWATRRGVTGLGRLPSLRTSFTVLTLRLGLLGVVRVAMCSPCGVQRPSSGLRPRLSPAPGSEAGPLLLRLGRRRGGRRFPGSEPHPIAPTPSETTIANAAGAVRPTALPSRESVHPTNVDHGAHTDDWIAWRRALSALRNP